jgi:hypothetical protein
MKEFIVGNASCLGGSMPCMLLTAGLKIIILEKQHKIIVNPAGQAF